MKPGNRKKRILLYFILVHFCLIGIVVTSQVIPAIQLCFSTEEERSPSHPVDVNYFGKALTNITNTPFIHDYLMISGTDVSYNFFAPKVANSLMIECVQKDKDHHVLSTMYFPAFLKSHEGLQRYTAALNNFHGAVRKASKVDKKYLFDELTESMGQKIINSAFNPATAYADIYFYSYEYPSIQNYNRSVKPQLISLSTIHLKKSKS